MTGREKSLYWKGLSKLRRDFSPDESFDEVPLPGDFIFGSSGVDGSGIGVVPFWSALINGLGKHRDLSYNNSMLKVFSVQQGTTYRFHLIGSTIQFAFRFSIDGHRLTVITTDGYYIQPVEADYVIIHSGERYDVLITANQTGQNDFWMRAETLEAEVNFFANPVELPPYEPLHGHETRAIIHYEGPAIPVGPEYAAIAEIPKTCSEESPCVVVNCPFRSYHSTFNITCINVDQLRLYFPTPVDELPLAEYDEQYFFNFAFESTRRLSSVNGRSFVAPKMPPQIFPNHLDDTNVCDLDDDCINGCFCTHKVDILYNKTIRFVFSTAGKRRNNRRFAHPIHFHGHSFHVVSAGYGVYNETTGEAIEPTKDIECGPGSNNRICIKPSWKAEPPVFIDEFTIRKDTVILPGLSYIVVHFRSTNPGWWLLHCHMLLHQNEGMELLINEAQARQPPAPEGICEVGDFTWSVEEFNEALQFQYTPVSSVQPLASTTQLPSTYLSTKLLSTVQPVPTQTATQPIRITDDDELSEDAIAGIVVGVAVFIAICVAVVLVIAIIYVAKGGRGKEKKQKDLGTTADTSTTIKNTGGDEIEMAPTEEEAT